MAQLSLTTADRHTENAIDSIQRFVIRDEVDLSELFFVEDTRRRNRRHFS